MKITCLIEDTCNDRRFKYEHGLSFYVEAAGRRILFDMGADDGFLVNARLLGIDISSVDTAVLSHGHYDHGGGLAAFLSAGGSSPVYLNRRAFGDYYHNTPEKQKYIGLDKSLKQEKRLVFVDEDCSPGNGLFLLTGISGGRMVPPGNRSLTCYDGKAFRPDRFLHEQSLAVCENGLYALFCGCSHCGLLNILDRFEERFGRMPDLVIGGFHLARKKAFDEKELCLMREMAKELSAMPSIFYTCHCTGEAAYEVMKPLMKDRLRYIRTGESIEQKIGHRE